ncbi:MAG: OmpH family outer membrane protein [Pseudomonadota bacterium]
MLSAPAVPQTFPLFDQSYAIGLLDQDRLFNESRYGLKTRLAFDARAEALALENQTIEQELEAEELALTQKRVEMSPEDFAPLAEAFNDKANRLRAEQREKTQDLVTFRENTQAAFVRQVGPILLQLMREFRVGVIIQSDAAILSLPDIDLTDEAIARVDAVFLDE